MLKHLPPLLALLFAFQIARAEDPPFLKDFQALKKETDAKLAPIYAKAQKDYEAAKTNEEREKVQTEVREATAQILPAAVKKAFEIGKANAADANAVEILAWVAETRSDKPSAHAAAELLTKHHLTHARTLQLASRMRSSGDPWVEPTLRALHAEPTLNTKDHARVTRELAICLTTSASMPGALAGAAPADLAKYEFAFGKERVAEMSKVDVAKLEAEAVKLYEELIAKYADEEVIRGVKFGTIAKSAIFEIQHLGVGKTAPEIEGEDLDGVKFKLGDYRGKAVMLTFWGSWCGPCMAQVPHERELVEKYKDKPFALIGVNSDADRQKLKQVLADEKITWRSFWCGPEAMTGPIPIKWNVSGWPTTYLIDHNGVIRSKNATGATLDARLEKLVAEAGSN